MIYAFKLPDIGEGLAEGEISSWLVKEGEQIQEDDGLVEIQNDKSVEEIPSPVTGTVKEIKVPAGQIAQVGDVLVTIETDHLPHGDEHIEDNQTAVVEEKSEHPAPTTQQVSTSSNNQAPQHEILAMPSVRKYARENHVDLQNVKPTGHKGHILKADIDNYLTGEKTDLVSTGANDSPAVQNIHQAVEANTQNTTQPMDSTRLAIAKAMSNAKQTAPHVTLFDEVEVSALVAHRQKYKGLLAEENIKLTFLPYIVKALTLTLKKFPMLNSTVDMSNKQIITHQQYNIGIATDTEHGLYVPVLFDADKLGLKTIADQIATNALKAKNKELTSKEMSGGTMTITNIGSLGGGYFTPIINVPEVAILGVGTIKKEPIVNENNEIVIGQMLKLSLSFDHRIIDGALAQQAMNYLKSLLKDPQMLLIEG